MTPEEQERMNGLCAEIQKEKNYDRFEDLARELTDLVARKERRFPEHKFLIPTPKGFKIMQAIANRVLDPLPPKDIERVELTIGEADELFREIRIPNSFLDAEGAERLIKPGAPVELRLATPAVNLREKPSSAPPPKSA